MDDGCRDELISKILWLRRTAALANTQAALIAMENCPGSQGLARKLQTSGHTVKIIPAQFVRPYVKSNKNGMVDAAANAEAAIWPTMRFVQIRQPEQSGRQALHRMRSIHEPAYRTHRLTDPMRGFLLEFGIAVRQGVGVFRLDIPRVPQRRAERTTAIHAHTAADLKNDFGLLDVRIEELHRTGFFP